MPIFYSQFIAVHTTASCCLEQTSTVRTTANRPDNTIPSSVPLSCWRAHTALPLLSPSALFNWSSLYHRLVRPIQHSTHLDGKTHWKGALNENYVWIFSRLLATVYILTSLIRILRKYMESRKMAALFWDLDDATTPPKTPPLHFGSEFRSTNYVGWDFVFYHIWLSFDLVKKTIFFSSCGGSPMQGSLDWASFEQVEFSRLNPSRSKDKPGQVAGYACFY